ncbi:MAG TPA: ABC transporter permease, partial [Polyangiaceae bacterium]
MTSDPDLRNASLDEMLGLSPSRSSDGPSVVGRFFASGRELRRVAKRTLHYALRGAPQPGAIATQLYEIGNRSAAFLCISMGFIGMIFVYQAGVQMKRVIP